MYTRKTRISRDWKPTDEIDVEELEEERQITRTTLFDIINGLNE
jgi:hypothetical protein